jgi:hypothetical protein
MLKPKINSLNSSSSSSYVLNIIIVFLFLKVTALPTTALYFIAYNIKSVFSRELLVVPEISEFRYYCIAAFLNYFMTALEAFSKISRNKIAFHKTAIKKTFINKQKLRSTKFKIHIPSYRK